MNIESRRAKRDELPCKPRRKRSVERNLVLDEEDSQDEGSSRITRRTAQKSALLKYLTSNYSTGETPDGEPQSATASHLCSLPAIPFSGSTSSTSLRGTRKADYLASLSSGDSSSSKLRPSSKSSSKTQTTSLSSSSSSSSSREPTSKSPGSGRRRAFRDRKNTNSGGSLRSIGSNLPTIEEFHRPSVEEEKIDFESLSNCRLSRSCGDVSGRRKRHNRQQTQQGSSSNGRDSSIHYQSSCLNSSFPATKNKAEDLQNRFKMALLEQTLFLFEEEDEVVFSPNKGQKSRFERLVDHSASSVFTESSLSSPGCSTPTSTLTPTSWSGSSSCSSRRMLTSTQREDGCFPTLPPLYPSLSRGSSLQDDEDDVNEKDEMEEILILSPSPKQNKLRKQLQMHLPKIPSRSSLHSLD